MINIGIDQQNRIEIARQLNILLANEYLVYTKTLKYHWNVYGKHFGAMHRFFKEQYEALFVIIDDIAERVRVLDVMSFGTMQEFLKYTTLEEDPGFNPEDLTMIADLLEDHEAVIRELRLGIESTSELGDEGTSNFMTDLMEKHEKIAWMLRAFLQNK